MNCHTDTYSFNYAVAQRTDILLAGYEMFVNAMKSNYISLLWRLTKGGEEEEKQLPPAKGRGTKQMKTSKSEI